MGVAVFYVSDMKHLDRCIKSVEWADDVFVVELGEKSSSGQEAKASVGRKQTDWVLHLWGEEWVEGELQEELLSLRERELSEAQPLYSIPVRSFVLGRSVAGSLWGPSPSPRLLPSASDWPPTWWSARKPIKGAGYLSSYITDDSTAELAVAVDRINRVTSLWASRLRSRSQDESFTRLAVLSFRVLLRFLMKPGTFGSGFAGLTLSVLAAYTTLLLGAKVWEEKKSGVRPSCKAPRGIAEL